MVQFPNSDYHTEVCFLALEGPHGRPHTKLLRNSLKFLAYQIDLKRLRLASPCRLPPTITEISFQAEIRHKETCEMESQGSVSSLQTG